MENKKVSKNCKSLILENGKEITYCEFGEENEEVILSGAFYLITGIPKLEELGKKYHVYAMIMQLDGEWDYFFEDGSPNVPKQWGEDMYSFAKALGLEKFHYAGKCHGTVPGWYLLKNYPEMLLSFSSLYMAPHMLPQNKNEWFEIKEREGVLALTLKAMRKKELLQVKLDEVASLGPVQGLDLGMKYGSRPEIFWDSPEEIEECLKNTKVPILYIFGAHDIFFTDWFDSCIKAMMVTNRAKSIILQEEYHLMELDAPIRMAREIDYFIQDSKNEY